MGENKGSKLSLLRNVTKASGALSKGGDRAQQKGCWESFKEKFSKVRQK